MDGALWSVSTADVRAAIAASSSGEFAKGKIYEIQIVGSREMHIYREPRSSIVSFEFIRKINGVWKSDGGIVAVTD